MSQARRAPPATDTCGAMTQLSIVSSRISRWGLLMVAEGRSAIRALELGPPDLVCLDLMLPELSGFEVCEFMRSRPELKDVPILVMSARAKPMDRAFAEEVGATAYLVKPFKRSEFSHAVNVCIARASSINGEER